MASKKIKGITIEIGADTLGLDKALKGVEQSSKKASDELREVNKVIKTSGDSATLWKQKQELLTTALEESKKKLDLLESAQEQVNRQLENGAINGDQYRAFQREVENARGEVKKYETGLHEANDKVKELGDNSDDTAKDIKELGDKADDTANGGISAMTVALGNLVYDGIKLAAGELKDFTKDVIETGSQFEAGMSKVGAISGASAEDIEKLTAKAEEMGATTKFTAYESSEAFEYMAMAGWKTEEMLGGIEGVLSLAAASGADLGTTSDIVTDAMTAFGLSANNAGHFADVLAAASSNANTNVTMMGETFKYVAPVAGAMKYSIEDTAEAIGLMANAGIKSTQSGTALRSIITRLSTDAGASKNSLGALGTLTEELGVQFFNTDGSARALGDVLAETRIKWQDLTAEQQTSYGKTIAGTNALSGWLALMNAAPEDVNKLSGAIRNCDGAATDMSTTMMDNLQGDMTLFSSAVDGAKIRLAKELNPAMRDVVQYMTKNVPNAEKAVSGLFKKGAEGTIFLIKNLPKIASAVKTLMPVIQTAVATLLAYKLYDRIYKTATLLTTMSGPQGAIIATVAAATLLVGVLSTLSENQSKEADIADKVAKEYEAEHKAVDDLRSSMNSMKDDFNNRANDIESESKRTEDLWKELDELADSTGKVKDADKKRAEYILGELSEALGKEYTMTGNQIDRYKEMEAEIDTLIEKKKAAAMLDTFIEQDAEYTKAQKESLEAYEQAGVKYEEADKNVKELQNSIRERLQGEYPEMIDYVFSRNKNLNEEQNLAGWASQGLYKGLDSDTRELVEKYLREYNTMLQNKQLMRSNKSAYEEAIAYQSKLHDAETAYAQGNYSDVSNILYSSNNDAALLEAETDLERRNAIFADMLKKSKQGIELALKTESKYAVKDAVEAFNKTVEAGQVASVDIGKAFKENFGDEIQVMLDKGWDITDLSIWAADSGIDIGDIFKDDYKTVVQKQIDKGFDIRNLVIWGANSGATTGSNYDEKFEQSVQDALDNFYPDADALMDWAREKGMAIGEVLGEKIGEYCIPDISDKIDYTKLVVANINSAEDARLARWGEYNPGIRYMADGGYLRSGQAVVAEAGPELLEIMNGGVKVTPLTGTSRNTPVQSSGAGQKIISITNKIYATVSGKYDVRRLAEDLAAEERLLESAKGL